MPGCDLMTFLGDTGAQHLADTLRVNTNLTEIYLSRNHIGDSGAKSLTDALRVNTCTALAGVDSSQNQTGNAGAQSLADALHDTNATLIELRLRCNPISDIWAQHLDGRCVTADFGERTICSILGSANTLTPARNYRLYSTKRGNATNSPCWHELE
eukprot:gb/GECG01009822.1/.p1 GENE.gb/GECG01009822.1/~~gb/GECG01009822.1/.p1  ORF type:complete len:156 (+),score=13.47 gb/GECG01009822.1/:1-468(+)